MHVLHQKINSCRRAWNQGIRAVCQAARSGMFERREMPRRRKAPKQKKAAARLPRSTKGRKNIC